MNVTNGYIKLNQSENDETEYTTIYITSENIDDVYVKSYFYLKFIIILSIILIVVGMLSYGVIQLINHL